MNRFDIFLLTLSGLLATQVPLSRPFTVTLTAGANRSWTAPPPLVWVLDGEASSPVVRMRASAQVTMPVRHRFALQFGAAYSQTGEISSYSEDFLEGPLIEERWELDYLEFSVLGRMQIPDEAKHLGLHVLAGPAMRCRSPAGRGERRRSGWEIAGQPRPGSTSCSTEEPEWTLGCTGALVPQRGSSTDSA